jgi:hypothetical protein
MSSTFALDATGTMVPITELSVKPMLFGTASIVSDIAACPESL